MIYRMLLVIFGTTAVACGILVVSSNISGKNLNYNYFHIEHEHALNSQLEVSVLHEFSDFENLLSFEHYNEVIDSLARENESFFKYDEKYFEQKAIILVEHLLTDEFVRFELKDVTRLDNEITVSLYRIHPYGGAGDVVRGTAFFFIEVYKNDIIDSTINVNISFPS